MSNQSRVPAIRFKGYADPWEQRKLSEVYSIESGKDYKHLEPGNVPVYGTGGYMTSVNRALCNEVSIGIGRKGTIDKPQLLNPPFWTVDTLFFMVPKEYDVAYLFAQSQLIPWKNYDESTGVPSLSKTAIGQIERTYPKMEEQKGIGALFAQVDSLITLHQRKLNKLKEMKKGLLEKMFPSEGNSVPSIRFKGYTDPWEQRELGEVVERILRKNDGIQSSLPLTVSAEYGLVDQISFFNNRIASQNIEGYYLLFKGDFAYNKSTSTTAIWGAVKRLDDYESGVLSTLYIVFKPTCVSSEYLLRYYETSYWYPEMQKIAAEGARNHGLLNIAPADFFKSLLPVPNSFEEQESIGKVIANVAKLIALHQRKLEKLKNIKKALLEKMFVA